METANPVGAQGFAPARPQPANPPTTDKPGGRRRAYRYRPAGLSSPGRQSGLPPSDNPTGLPSPENRNHALIPSPIPHP